MDDLHTVARFEALSNIAAHMLCGLELTHYQNDRYYFNKKKLPFEPCARRRDIMTAEWGLPGATKASLRRCSQPIPV